MTDRSQLEQFFLDESSNTRTKGEPCLQSKDGTQMFCPKCLSPIDADAGYGLAFGGMGSYWVCDAEGCDWFYKIMDRDEE